MPATKTAAAAETLDALIFIDTNIFLDFYRVRGWDSGLSVLTHIAANHDRIITGSQIEMEFKKNRQRVILDSLGKVKSPDWAGLSVPTFMQGTTPSKVVNRAKQQIDAQMKRMRARIEAVLTNPARNDPVYQAAQALFRDDTEYNLSRRNEARATIRRLALKRFMLGYPPRKDSDTSVGDAINWEWIIRCAVNSGKDIIIVSRDSDYGHSFQKVPILNDWLRQEFVERTSRRRKLVLTDRLTDAFRRVAVRVTDREVEQENDLIAASQAHSQSWKYPNWLTDLLSADELSVVSAIVEAEDDSKKTPEEVAKRLAMSTEAVRAHQASALEKLRAVTSKRPAI